MDPIADDRSCPFDHPKPGRVSRCAMYSSGYSCIISLGILSYVKYPTPDDSRRQSCTRPDAVETQRVTCLGSMSFLDRQAISTDASAYSVTSKRSEACYEDNCTRQRKVRMRIACDSVYSSTSPAATLGKPITSIPSLSTNELLSVLFVVTAHNSTQSSTRSSPLVLELLVVVVAHVGPRDVVSVPRPCPSGVST